jgi:hypothetical protein
MSPFRLGAPGASGGSIRLVWPGVASRLGVSAGAASPNGGAAPRMALLHRRRPCSRLCITVSRGPILGGYGSPPSSAFWALTEEFFVSGGIARVLRL